MKFPAPEEMAGWTEEQTRQFWRSLDVKDKEQTAIARLQEASRMSLQVYKQPLVVTTSGGKDSSVCVALAERAGIQFEVQHNHTTADAPETVYFVREEFKRLEAAGIKCSLNYPVYKGKRTSIIHLGGKEYFESRQFYPKHGYTEYEPGYMRKEI